MTGLSALLDDQAGVGTEPGQPIHPCAHWMYFVPAVPQGEVDLDGHPKRGGFIPPLPQARRMWASSRMTYHADLCVGDRVDKTSRISDITAKSGKSGPLVFLEIDHLYRCGGNLVREETQTLVYRDH